MTIELKSIYKSYDNKSIISNLSYTFQCGKKYCFYGPSGQGKTTLLRILMGLESIDKGSIVHKNNKKSVVFQEDRLFMGFTVIENLMAVNNDYKFCINIIEKMGLLYDENTICKNLSGGMKRRVAIARALAFNSDEYYFDEPFKGLDENTKNKVIETVNEFTKDKTCFFITHDIQEAFDMDCIILSVENSPISCFVEKRLNIN